VPPPLPAGAFVYPWDVVGDPAAADRVAGLGVAGVTLAAVYHATRALTPRHPAHKVVTTDRSAAYFPLHRWAAPVPLAATTADPFGTAAIQLDAAGLPVSGWAVLLHVDGVAAGPVVRNAYGDRYPWALCAARPESVDYACAVAAAVAGRPGLATLELEACGWYGFGHLHAHDKTAGVALTGAADFLMSLCFCAACDSGYRAEGLEPERLRQLVTAALDRVFAGTPTGSTVESLLGAAESGAVLTFRNKAGDALRAAVVKAVRAVAGPGLPVLLHADPDPYRTGANVGLDVPAALRVADGLVVPADRVPLATGAGGRIVANLPIVSGLGGQPRALRDQLEAAARDGATGARLYHAGLAGDADLLAVREALRA
jgi:hypothetical protein